MRAGDNDFEGRFEYKTVFRLLTKLGGSCILTWCILWRDKASDFLVPLDKVFFIVYTNSYPCSKLKYLYWIGRWYFIRRLLFGFWVPYFTRLGLSISEICDFDDETKISCRLMKFTNLSILTYEFDSVACEPLDFADDSLLSPGLLAFDCHETLNNSKWFDSPVGCFSLGSIGAGPGIFKSADMWSFWSMTTSSGNDG